MLIKLHIYRYSYFKLFSGPVINIVRIYRLDCKFKVWSVNLSIIIVRSNNVTFVRLS